jgi:hypothetical protein
MLVPTVTSVHLRNKKKKKKRRGRIEGEEGREEEVGGGFEGEFEGEGGVEEKELEEDTLLSRLLTCVQISLDHESSCRGDFQSLSQKGVHPRPSTEDGCR